MPLDKKDILEILEHARGMGISTLKVEGLEVNFGSVKPTSAPETVPDAKPEEIVTPLSPLDEMTEEEIKYWATPYYDELMAKKAEAQKKKTEDMGQ